MSFLRIIGAGDAFGGAGAFGDLTYPIGAEAVEPAVALVLTSNAIRQLLETEPRLASMPCNSSPADCTICSAATASS
jgi:CRP-like cAMP-binding protein